MEGETIYDKKYIIDNGLVFNDQLSYGGDEYDSFIVKYDQNNNEHIYTGIIYELYENGNIANYYEVKAGIKEGLMVYFFPNGQIKEIKRLEKNSLEGLQKEFSENGVIKSKEHRVSGRLMSFKKYDSKGNIIEEETEPAKIELNYRNM
ncbi:hypothetical protein J9317_03920 [Metabacillus sp. KIGAM252]|uniref:Uncharacterized protein n=1 Tax=Metabacillus flavus TaxID=2823519 RepID=A0ABS5LB32_9BACI|nr:hypothetical protein [Metabacillus flavus]MBS2967921.1 hypothetical protein [Metabacillus flavus]